MRAIIVGVLGAAAFLLNPLYACDPFQEDFQYSEQDMRSAIEGTWELTVRHPGQQPWKMTFRIEQGAQADMEHASAGWIRSAAACSNRTLVKSAHACIDVSMMPLKFIAIGDGGTPVRGRFMISGTRFEQGELVLDLPHGWLQALISPTGIASELSDKDATFVRRGRG